jgi:hypothetical protein
LVNLRKTYSVKTRFLLKLLWITIKWQAKRLTKASREINKTENPDGKKANFKVDDAEAKNLATETLTKNLLIKKIEEAKQEQVWLLKLRGRKKAEQET